MQFKTSLGKKPSRCISINKKLGVVAHACHPSYTGNINRRITIQASLGINARLYSKKTYKEKKE
jgi:hypothetical protein